MFYFRFTYERPISIPIFPAIRIGPLAGLGSDAPPCPPIVGSEAPTADCGRLIMRLCGRTAGVPAADCGLVKFLTLLFAGPYFARYSMSSPSKFVLSMFSSSF